ncbi:DUF4424 family protein [Acinetobacter sp. ANC 4639]
MTNKWIILFGLLSIQQAFANDSAGYVATGGVQYVKNPNIAMQTEDLLISQKKVQVDYQFKNLTDHPITENILFPLPLVESWHDSDYADTADLVKSFKVWSNGKQISPQVHVRAFLPQLKSVNDVREHAPMIDVTAELKACGWSDAEMMSPWTEKYNASELSRKMLRCQQPKLQKLLKLNEDVWWQSQIIYSWQQTFLPNQVTRVRHQYTPLLGGAIYLYPEEAKIFCVDDNLKKALRKMGNPTPNYLEMGYILKTGANWAKPIERFNLTIEKQPNQFVSLCWKGQLKKVSATQFKATEKNFIPRQDIQLIFIDKPSP